MQFVRGIVARTVGGVTKHVVFRIVGVCGGWK
jgi:hypothetical protein